MSRSRPDPAPFIAFTDAAAAWLSADRAEVAVWTSRDMRDLRPYTEARVAAERRLMAAVAALDGVSGLARRDASLLASARRWRTARAADAAATDLVARLLAGGERRRAERALRVAVERWQAAGTSGETR